MKIYNKVVINIKTGETIYKESFEYSGPIAEAKGGSSGNTIDYEYNSRIASIMEEQLGMSKEDYYFWQGLERNPNYNPADAGKYAPPGANTTDQYIPNPNYTEGGGQAISGIWWDSDGVAHRRDAQRTSEPKTILNPYYGKQTAPEGVDTTSEWTPILGADGKPIVSGMDVDIAKLAANAALIPKQTQLTTEQINAELSKLPAQTKLELEQLAAEFELTGANKDLVLAQIASQLNILPGQTALTQEQIQSARELIPKQTELGKSNIDLQLKEIAAKSGLVGPEFDLALANITSQLEILPGQTQLTKAQIDKALTLIPQETQLTSAQIQAELSKLPEQTKLDLQKIAAEMGLVGPQADLALAQIVSQLNLLPGQTQLTSEQIAAARQLLPQQTAFQEAQMKHGTTMMGLTEESAKTSNQAQQLRFGNLQDLMGKANINPDEWAGKAVAGVNQAYKNAPQSYIRNVTRTGAGLDQSRLNSFMKDMALQKAKDTGMAITTAKRDADTETFKRMLEAGTAGAGI